jgi:peroxiredoxin
LFGARPETPYTLDAKVGRGKQRTQRPREPEAVQLVLAIAGFVVFGLLFLFVCLLLFQLMGQNGRLLRRLDAVENVVGELLVNYNVVAPAKDEAGLPIGAAAPYFELPDIYGHRRSLAEWRGQRLLLIFFDPHGSFSLEMLPALAALSSDVPADRPTPVIITTGDADENRRLFGGHSIAWTVLLDEDGETAAAYQVDGTPMGYLVARRQLRPEPARPCLRYARGAAASTDPRRTGARVSPAHRRRRRGLAACLSRTQAACRLRRPAGIGAHQPFRRAGGSRPTR